MTDLELARRLSAGRTKGPWHTHPEESWKVYEDNHPNSDVLGGHLISVSSPKDHWSYGMTSCLANARFIAWCGSNFDSLLDELEALRKVAEAASLLVSEMMDNRPMPQAIDHALTESQEALAAYRALEKKP